ncbi:MAG: hypothetical protein HY925_01715 [Elusimicrobia bacterium]|nr:hypothetical protein [Elusimicrobiota bacterium]
MRSPLYLALVAIIAVSGCHREPPDITEAQAKDIADKEQPKWCDSEGFHCTDFRYIGKQPPVEAGFEYCWQWGADLSPKAILMSVMVTKKGTPAVRIQGVPAGSLPAGVGGLVASAPKPGAPATPGTPAKPGAPAATPTPAPAGAAAATAKTPAPTPATLAKLDPNDPKPRTPPPLDPAPTTPPPLAPDITVASNFKALEPTLEDVFRACETEIGILCLSSPSSVPQARSCLRPHRAALRNACGKMVGLKRSDFEDD